MNKDGTYGKQSYHRDVTCVLIFLADDEWHSSGIMEEVARQAFLDYPSVDCVEVHEHSGWFLTYNRSMQIVSTANDCCTVTPAMEAFWKDVWAKNYVATIRRKVAEHVGFAVHDDGTCVAGITEVWMSAEVTMEACC